MLDSNLIFIEFYFLFYKFNFQLIKIVMNLKFEFKFE